MIKRALDLYCIKRLSRLLIFDFTFFNDIYLSNFLTVALLWSKPLSNKEKNKLMVCRSNPLFYKDFRLLP